MTPKIQNDEPWVIGPTWARDDEGQFILPERTLGWGIINWLYEWVLTPGGPHAGKPFMPTLEQARWILWWYAVDESGRFVYRTGTLRRLKGWGKDPIAGALALVELLGPVEFSHFDEDGNAIGKPKYDPWVQIAAVSQDQPLALDTEVPTPNGWVTVGDLAVGDYVYGSDGEAHRVERETEVLEGLDCYKVKFDDGTEIVASASHGWTTERLNGHGDKYEVVTQTTEELAATVRGSKGRKRHRIPVVGFDGSEKDLLVDPWFLGLWLGDGKTTDSSVVFEAARIDEYRALVSPLVQDYQTVTWSFRENPTGSWGEFRIRNKDRRNDDKSLRNQLRIIGVLGNKHIPQDYMTGSREQRIALLQGLVDSDGGVDKNGRCYFVNKNQGLVHQFRELVEGLGFRCTVRSTGDALRAEFAPGDLITVSRLGYKAERQRAYTTRSRSQYRWVESVEKVESVPVKCIGIDTEDHLFQVTRQRILTHNTRNTFTLFPALISPQLKEEHKLELHKTLIYDGRGKMIEGVTSSPLALEGKRPTFIIMNETQWWVDTNGGHDMYRVIEGNVTKSAYGTCRSLAICNAHVPGQDSVGEKDWDYYLKVSAGQAEDTGMMYDALEAPPDTPVSEIPSRIEDPEGFEAGIEKLRQGLIVARGDATWLDVDIIIQSILDIRNPVSESRRKFLNQVNAAEDSWISPSEWDRCRGKVQLEPGDKITLGFDGSKSNDHTAISACRIEDGAIFLIKTWDPEKCRDGVVPREEVDATIRSMFERYNVVGFRADVHEFESYVDEWGRDFKRQLKVKASPGNPVAFDMRGQKKPFALDCERFLDAVLEGELVHDGNQALRWYVLNCHRHPTNYDAVAVRKESKDSSRKIDGAITAILAFGARQAYMMSKNYRGKGKGGVIL